MQTNSKPPVDQSETPKVWYREFWAWFILAPLIVVVIVSTFTVTVAVYYSDDRVIDNYYKEGRLINNRLDEDLAAAELKLHASLQFDRLVEEVVVYLQADTDVFPDTIALNLSHPSDEELDHTLVLSHVARGQYQGELSQDLDFRWYIKLQPLLAEGEEKGDDFWRLRGEINFATQSKVDLIVEW